MNPGLRSLPPYPFQRLDDLLRSHRPGMQPYLSLAEGDPGLPTPNWIQAAIADSPSGYGRYTPIPGTTALRAAIADSLARRFALPSGSLDPQSQVLATAGAREGVFSAIQALGERGGGLIFANPFYAIYAGAGQLAGMQLMPQRGQPNWLREISQEQLSKCSLMVLCTPDNPTGRTLSMDDLAHALELADRHGFNLVADECYADIYLDRPPPGLLQACAEAGRTDWRRCLVIHSLSKRSGLTGLRAGALAGDADLIAQLRLYRSYHGVSLTAPVQEAAAAAWADDALPAALRQDLRARFDAFAAGLRRAGAAAMPLPHGGFYHYHRLDGPWRGKDLEFAVQAHRDKGLRVLPARFMADDAPGMDNPGAGHLRISVIGPAQDCEQAAYRLGQLLGEGPDPQLSAAIPATADTGN